MKKIFISIFLTCMLTMLGACVSNSDSDYYYIDRFFIEGDETKLRSSVDQMSKDMYNWYESIEGKDGVYILNSVHYSTKLMREWRDSHYNIYAPDMDLWYFTVSPNYLIDTGLDLPEKLIDQAKNGTRLYLLPDIYSEEDKNKIKSFLTTDALNGLDGNNLLETRFQNERTIVFETYHYDGGLDSLTQGEIKNPIIYVATTQNMKFIESESLIATGIEDGYIKLTEEAYTKYVRKQFPENLKKNQVTFIKH
ncbi:hypothetical protein NQZ89_10065 [Streptococcus suis]|uniref:hypothetical protein n=1 Tax=Streptococcus TaxID=1301 RepID=UPI000CF43187|nr:hypothetical protein [Streptococcus suis]UUM58442.1 hypothetical protein NQZ91_03475 [Streptococcus suis]UUM61709.1 hypothetical protein NQZ89_10065 [Streptococcus suis]